MPTPKTHASANGRNGKAPSRKTPAPSSGRPAPQTLEDAIVAAAASGKLAEATRSTLRAQSRAGRPITYQRGSQIVREYPDGRREVLGTVTPSTYKLPKGIRRIHNG